MTKFVSQIMMTAAAAGMAFAPIAAQANTRASSAAAVPAAWSGQILSYASLLCTSQAGGCLLPLREPAPVAQPPAPEAPAVPVEEAAPVIAKKGGSSLIYALLGLGVLLGGALAFSGGGSGGSNQSNGAN